VNRPGRSGAAAEHDRRILRNLAPASRQDMSGHELMDSAMEKDPHGSSNPIFFCRFAAGQRRYKQ
jgi:hypothetical protein